MWKYFIRCILVEQLARNMMFFKVLSVDFGRLMKGFKLHLSPVSIVSSLCFDALKTTVDTVNKDIPQDRQDLVIDKQTKFKSLLQTAKEDLANRYPDELPSSKRNKLWQNIKKGLTKFCQVVYHYSSVMDVLVSSHPEFAALACKIIP